MQTNLGLIEREHLFQIKGIAKWPENNIRSKAFRYSGLWKNDLKYFVKKFATFCSFSVFFYPCYVKYIPKIFSKPNVYQKNYGDSFTAWKCPNTEFSLVHIFLYLDWIQKFGVNSVFSPNTDKHRLEESDFNSQSLGEKLEIQLEKPALNNFKAYRWRKWKTKTGGFDMKSKICYTTKSIFIFINKLSFHTGNIVKLQ